MGWPLLATGFPTPFQSHEGPSSQLRGLSPPGQRNKMTHRCPGLGIQGGFSRLPPAPVLRSWPGPLASVGQALLPKVSAFSPLDILTDSEQVI